MGNKLTKKAVIVASIGVVSAFSIGYGIYHLIAHRNFDKRLNYELSKIKLMKNDGRVKGVENNIYTKDIARILTLMFKFSYEYKKKEKDKMRQERVHLLTIGLYSDYVKRLLDSYKFDTIHEKELKEKICGKLDMTCEGFFNIVKESEVMTKQPGLSLTMVDELGLHVKLNEKEARKLHKDKENLIERINLETYQVEVIENEARKEMGEEWERTLKTLIMLDILYLEYKLDPKEIAVTLKKHKLGLT